LSVKGRALRARQAGGLLAAGDTSGRRPRSRRPPTTERTMTKRRAACQLVRVRRRPVAARPAPFRTSLRPPLRASKALLRRVTTWSGKLDPWPTPLQPTIQQLQGAGPGVVG